MYKSRARVYTDIAFHAKFPLVAFLSLVHFWITFFFCIFGGTWRIYYCCVNYCSTMHYVSCRFHYTIYRFKKLFAKMIFFNHVTKFQKRSCVGYLLTHEIYFHKFTECITVINRVLYSLIGKIEPYLQQIHPEHCFYSFGRSAALAIGIIRAHIFYPLLPWDYFFHYVKKFFSLCCSLPITVFHIAECYLFHFFSCSAFFLVFIIPYFLLFGYI